MSNFFSFSYFQTFFSLGVEQGLQKLPKFDINDLRLLFHCNILIPKKCPRKTLFKAQCSPLKYSNVFYGCPQTDVTCTNCRDKDRKGEQFYTTLPQPSFALNVVHTMYLCTYVGGIEGRNPAVPF